MDLAFVISQRLDELRLGQRDLAAACQVTESYISQLLGRKKLPPLPNRTNLYAKMSPLLGIPLEELARLAALQHQEALDRTWRAAPEPRFAGMREQVLQKCRPARQAVIRKIFEKEAFGDIERLITRTIIETIRDEARDPTSRPRASGPGPRAGRPRTDVMDFVDSDPAASIAEFARFIDPLIRSWDFNLSDFNLSIELSSGTTRTFSFQETASEEAASDRAGLRSFLRDKMLNSGATAEEIEFLRRIRFPGTEQPTAVFYYRTLQSLRDPLNFRPASAGRP